MTQESCRSLEHFFRDLGWKWDIGTVIKDDDLRTAYNKHVSGLGKSNLEYPPEMITEWRRLVPEMFWDYFV